MTSGRKSSTGGEIQGEAYSQSAAFQRKIEGKQSDIWAKEHPWIEPLQTGIGFENGVTRLQRFGGAFIMDNPNRRAGVG